MKKGIFGNTSDKSNGKPNACPQSFLIEEITERTIHLAAMIHSASWQESHRSFCSKEFISAHTPERQKEYLKKIINEGAAVYLMTNAGNPVGIVSVNKSLIENLYVLPTEQRQGYGTVLLKHAVVKCEGKIGRASCRERV